MIQSILIVDDSAVARKMLKSCLPKDREFQIHEAKDGAEAVAVFEEARPDLTFMDLTMPEMDGYGAIERIRKIDPQALIVVTTSDIQKRALERVKEMGAYSVLKKPPRSGPVKEVLSELDGAQ